MAFGSVMRFSATQSSLFNAANNAGKSFVTAHGFTAADGTTKVVPSIVRGVLVCTADSDTYTAGDEVGFESVASEFSGDEYGVSVGADDTNVFVYFDVSYSPYIVDKNGASQPIDPAKWKIKVYAAY